VSCLVFCILTLLVDMFLNVYMCVVDGGQYLSFHK